ncbi:enoyl-CoA hydratase-related protein [Thermus filiformis]|uniref:Enoyl-CoA hydratase n=1 Tax=Thermus filiformis TaxID=276 RepID=A0A0A2WPA4_THEFI|nr:enoyl-CoA hydratase-related protein [Thermus filiformis]KGQ21623.1 enoyl-CoA hydratase [Thermus filiformis]
MLEKTRSENVLVLALNRPEVNALTSEVLSALAEALEEARKDPGVRALVLTGKGRAFSAGQDLKEFGDQAPDYEAHLRKYNRVVEALVYLDKPTVAALNGAAAGAGLSLALACDFRLASEEASLTTAFSRIGLVPDSGMTFFLPRLVGYAKALELILLSPRLSAREALELGLVHRVVAPERLLEEALGLAHTLAQGPTRAFALAKKALLESHRLSLEEALALEAVLQGEAGQSLDHQEGVRAFLEKRPPRFTGR